MTLKKLIFALSLAAVAAQAQAGVVLAEGFNTPGLLVSAGWVKLNPNAGKFGWEPGDDTTLGFGAQSGPADSFVQANFGNAPVGGMLDSWLITPLISLAGNRLNIDFWARTQPDVPGYIDRLQVRYSTTTATPTLANVGAQFARLLVDINPAAVVDGMPSEWTRYTASISTGFAAGTRGRIGFEYVGVADNANLVALDNVTVSVPEPVSLSLVGISLAALGVSRRKRKAQAQA